MKTLVTIALVAVMGITANAQNKNAKHNLNVKGNCGQCKDRIEKAAYAVDGVKVASWNEETQNLSIILNEKKNTVDVVEDAVVAVGHDTNGKKADGKVYTSLPACCLYDREGEQKSDAVKEMNHHMGHAGH